MEAHAPKEWITYDGTAKTLPAAGKEVFREALYKFTSREKEYTYITIIVDTLKTKTTWEEKNTPVQKGDRWSYIMEVAHD